MICNYGMCVLQIVERRQPAEIVHEDDDLIVFKDINPKAAVHVSFYPRNILPR